MKNMLTDKDGLCCESFTPVPDTEREAVLSEPRTTDVLERAQRATPALRQTEWHPSTTPMPNKTSVRIAAWNLQQGHFPAASASLLRTQGIDLALLSEVDAGLRRTGQRHVMQDMAAEMGDGWGYGLGVEFFEMLSVDNPFNPNEPACGNRLGFHCNGWLSRLPAQSSVLIRLEREADWFIEPRRNQRRLGGRVAVGAVFSAGDIEFVGAVTHLESDTDKHGRERQMRSLLSALDEYADGLPIILGGDFNTGARDPDLEYSAEGVFDAARDYGFSWDASNADGPTSRCSKVVNARQQNTAHYDWLFVKGLTAFNPGRIEAIGSDGAPISDHDAVYTDILTMRKER